MRRVANKRLRANDFGALGKAYDAARRGYPEAVFAFLKTLASGRKLRILDIGCGTGISTRQLKQHKFDVIGVDKDPAMIRLARRRRGSRIRYVVAPADKLPFKKGEFDLVTAFTAFHWFTDKKSVREIKRVLKKGGVFFTALKRPSKNKRFAKLNRAYVALLKKYAGDFDSAKNYNSKKALKENGFVLIGTKSFYFEEKYSLKNALILIRSNSYWHFVPDKLKSEFCQKLEALYKKTFGRGSVIRDREAEVVVGRLP